ncbi:hypothetical protein [Mucilaginibacter flavus]|uniref:hypothetical protein n=1 Tax=Mucilaginibacter flavus TaxID=931504 RepID=UPI0025B381D6|nr:hypothetical protein [Mucilaginibacter flavus]MDN3584668.1 hypothetical protein [Mucilaginibacter flavus]
MAELDKFNGFLFVDEVKHTVANGEGEDSFYYFGIAVRKDRKPAIDQEYRSAVAYLPKGFHATKAYKNKSVDTALLQKLTDIIINFKLHLVVFRYDKHKLYEATKEFLTTLNHPEIAGRESNWEMQAFFHFVQHLNIFLANNRQDFPVPLCAFCDKGIYGINDPIEAVDIPSPDVQRAVFTSRNKIKLLGLADHAGFIFAKSRLATHQAPGKNSQAVLQNNVFGQQLARIGAAGLFHYLEA